MYKASASHQTSFDEFNRSCGMNLDPTNDWCRIALLIPWHKWVSSYAALFPSRRGRPAIPLRTALGALLIQKRLGLSDRNLVKAITENPYLQYFLGLASFSPTPPFKPSVLVSFRKRLSADFLQAANEDVLAGAPPTPEHVPNKRGRKRANPATLILDATCSPDELRPPHDTTLLEEARAKTDKLIDALHAQFPEEGRHPRTYRRVMRQAYLRFSRARKRPAGAAKALCGKLLGALRRNLAFIDAYLARGGRLDEREQALVETIRTVYAQQKQMHKTGETRVAHRIVSLAKPWVRPIVRGKILRPVEFGAKYEVSLDEKGHARLEKLQFEAYNECNSVRDAVERYRERCGKWPERVLVDRIYRTKENRKWCELRGIKLAGRAQAKRPPTKAERKEDADRNEVERFFSRGKRVCGAGLLRLRLEETTLGAVALSVLAANVFGIRWEAFFVLWLENDPEAGAGRAGEAPILVEMLPPIA